MGSHTRLVMYLSIEHGKWQHFIKVEEEYIELVLVLSTEVQNFDLSRLILLFSTWEAIRDVTDRQRRLDRELGQ